MGTWEAIVAGVVSKLFNSNSLIWCWGHVRKRRRVGEGGREERTVGMYLLPFLLFLASVEEVAALERIYKQSLTGE